MAFSAPVRRQGPALPRAGLCLRTGVLQAEGPQLVSIEEKPNQSFYVNAGVYVLSPGVAEHIEPGKPLDMPDLFRRVIAQDGRACVYPIREYWRDIGRPEDLERARDEYATLFD